MRKKSGRRITAMAMAVMMAAASFSTGNGLWLTYAQEQSDEKVVFPDVYTEDLVQPEEDDEVVNAKVEALIKTMTTEEKYTFLGGNGTGDSEGNAGYLKGVPRLGVPMIKMYDGPAGLLYTQDTTNPPQEQMLAATWDEEMAKIYGETVGNENQAIGGSFMLSAQLDIQRIPQFQRTKDQMGEDPYLLSSLADDLVSGMQENGGIAVLKHFAAFAQNASPAAKTNVEVSEQALHEVYLPGFESAIKDGGALGVMSSYNALHGTLASASTELQQDILRDMWGYEYFTITDWGGNDGYTLNKGTDIEMPSLSNNSQAKTQEKVENGEMTQEEADQLVDQSVRRILKAYGKGGYLTLVQVDENGYAKEEKGRTELIRAGKNTGTLEELYEESNAAVEKVAEEGGVLLKNENETLPLNTDGDNTVAVIGLNGMNLIPGIGGERSYGAISAMTSPYEALCDLVGEEKVEGEVYKDTIGTIIPEENLYTTADGEEHGAVRTYGTGQSAETGGDYQGQFVSNSVPETAMEGHEIGEYCTTDATIDFNTGTVDGEPNKTYVNSEDGTAFDYTQNPAYTWTTYVEADEDGEYSIILQSIGAKAAMGIFEIQEDGTETQIGSGSGASVNQGTQWYSGVIPSETGENLSTATVTLEKGKRYKIGVAAENAGEVDGKDMQVGLAWITPSQKQANVDNAIQAAKDNDTVVVFAYAQVSDPKDTREETTLKLPAEQQQMILDVANAAHSAGNKVVVVLNNDSAVVMEDWIDEADAILEMYYPGQRGGVATAKLLTGEVNPSGKLAYTIPKKDTDTIITYSDYNWSRYEQEDEKEEEEGGDSEGPGGFPGGGPGGPGGGPGGFPGFASKDTTTYFDEGINTGYKWYDENDIEPQFDFGYGLSYTTFEYSDMKVEESLNEGEEAGYDVTFTVTNTGDVAGSEVAQVYLGEANVPEGIQTSEYALAGYEKVKDIQPGESREVTIHVSERSLSYWNSNQDELNVNEDGTKDKWTVAEGARTIYVGASSDNLLMQEEVKVEAKSDAGEENETVKASLDRMIALLESLDASEYTEESWAEVEAALENAKSVQADANATQEDLDEAMSSLIQAFGNLEYGVQRLHLETAIEAAEAILASGGDYEGGVKALEKAVEEAKAVLKDAKATQSEVNEAAYAVLDELAKLAKNADVSSLESLVKAATPLLDGNYTSSSLDALRKAIERAQEVIENSDRGEDEISEAYTAIVDAIFNLQMKGNKAALKAMIDKAQEILQASDSYVASTIQGLSAAMANAKSVYNNEEATQSQVDKAVETLTKQVALARLVGDVNGDGAVSTADGTALLQYTAEMQDLNDAAKESADVNGDGVTDTKDAVLVLQYASEKIATF